MESRLKATSHLDAARRLTYLALYAHELEDREQIPRNDLNAVLKEAGLFDSNSSKWVSQSSDLFLDGESVGLKVPGRERARGILNEVLNPDVPNTWVLGSGSTRRRGKSDATESDGCFRYSGLAHFDHREWPTCDRVSRYHAA